MIIYVFFYIIINKFWKKRSNVLYLLKLLRKLCFIRYTKTNAVTKKNGNLQPEITKKTKSL